MMVMMMIIFIKNNKNNINSNVWSRKRCAPTVGKEGLCM